MNHKVRAKSIVGRSMPRPLAERLIPGWISNIEKEVARGLRQAERDAHRRAIALAANYIFGIGIGVDLPGPVRQRLSDGILKLMTDV